MSEKVFLPDPLLPDPPQTTPPFLMAERSGHTKTIEEERMEDLETYRLRELSETKEEPLKLETETKEEPLDEVVQHDVAVAEATAGKIKIPKLPTVISIKTIRLDIEKFSAFYDKKFYRVKLDYDLYFEVNAKDREECVEKILKFIKSQLKGMLDTTEEDMEISEFIPTLRRSETDTDYTFD